MPIRNSCVEMPIDVFSVDAEGSVDEFDFAEADVCGDDFDDFAGVVSKFDEQFVKVRCVCGPFQWARYFRFEVEDRVLSEFYISLFGGHAGDLHLLAVWVQ